MTSPQTTPMPGEELKADKMPGHWLLARLGKRVLRPGGRQLTSRMIEALSIGPFDAQHLEASRQSLKVLDGSKQSASVGANYVINPICKKKTAIIG